MSEITPPPAAPDAIGDAPFWKSKGVAALGAGAFATTAIPPGSPWYAYVICVLGLLAVIAMHQRGQNAKDLARINAEVELARIAAGQGAASAAATDTDTTLDTGAEEAPAS